MESFGRFLTQQRELRGMTRAEVLRLTRLPPQAVEALEEERFETLPGKAFAVGYLRVYAGAIGMDADEAVLRFEEWLQAHPDALAAPVRAATVRRRPPRWAIAAAAAVAVAAGWWWIS